MKFILNQSPKRYPCSMNQLYYVQPLNKTFRYSFTNRGEIFVKGKGMVETFLFERETDL